MSLLTVTDVCLQNDLGRPLCATVASQKIANQQKKYPFFSEVPQHAQKNMGCDVIRTTQQYITYFCTFLETGTRH